MKKSILFLFLILSISFIFQCFASNDEIDNRVGHAIPTPVGWPTEDELVPTGTTYYVNTASTAGGTGLTNATTGDDRAFATLSEAESLNLDLTTATGIDDNVIIQCSGTSADTTTFTWSGWTTEVGHQIYVVGDYNITTGVHWSDSYYHLVTSGTTITVQQNYINFIKIQFATTQTTDNATIVNTDSPFAINSTWKRCIFKGSNNSNGHQGMFIASAATSTVNIYNCIYYDCYGGVGNAATNIYAASTNVTVNIYNSTLSGAYWGVRIAASVSINIINSAIFNNTDDISGTPTTLTYTACDDADCDSGTGNVGLADNSTDWNTLFVDYSNKNFHILNTDSALYNVGSDLSSYFTNDIDNATRSTFDIGADEL